MSVASPAPNLIKRLKKGKQYEQEALAKKQLLKERQIQRLTNIKK